MTKNSNSENDVDGSVIEKTDPKTKKPPMYKVMLLNDDFTPMEFVVTVLEKFFKIGRESAISIMLDVHQKGLAVVGVFSNEVAETKVTQVMDYAKKMSIHCSVQWKKNNSHRSWDHLKDCSTFKKLLQIPIII